MGKRLSNDEEEVRRTEAIRMRAMKFTLAEIAETLGYSDAAAASRAIAAGRKKFVRESTDDLLLAELHTLDGLQRGIRAAALAGDYKAIETTLKITDMRAKLVGMYAPPLKAEETVANVNIMIDPRLLPPAARTALEAGYVTGEVVPDGS